MLKWASKRWVKRQATQSLNSIHRSAHTITAVTPAVKLVSCAQGFNSFHRMLLIKQPSMFISSRGLLNPQINCTTQNETSSEGQKRAKYSKSSADSCMDSPTAKMHFKANKISSKMTLFVAFIIATKIKLYFLFYY